MQQYTFKQLLIFKETIKEGSMNKAARNLGMNQSAVSRTIQKLENSLGFKLFSRYKNTLALTREGKKFLLGADKLVDALQDFNDRLEHIQQGLKELRFGVPTGFSVQFAPQVIANYSRLESALRIRLDIRSSHALCADVRRGSLDMALVAELTDPSSAILCHKIFSPPLVCIVPADSDFAQCKELTVDDIIKHDVIFPSKLDIAGVWVDGISMKLFKQARIISNIGAIIGLVNQGLGIAVLNIITATDFAMDNIRIIPLIPTMPLDIFLICRADWMENHDLNEVVSCIQKTVEMRKQNLPAVLANSLEFYPYSAH